MEGRRTPFATQEVTPITACVTIGMIVDAGLTWVRRVGVVYRFRFATPLLGRGAGVRGGSNGLDFLGGKGREEEVNKILIITGKRFVCT